MTASLFGQPTITQTERNSNTNPVSPLTIELMIAARVLAYPHQHAQWVTPAGQHIKSWLQRHGLIDADLRATEKGEKWLDAICATPIPEETCDTPSQSTLVEDVVRRVTAEELVKVHARIEKLEAAKTPWAKPRTFDEISQKEKKRAAEQIIMIFDELEVFKGE